MRYFVEPPERRAFTMALKPMGKWDLNYLAERMLISNGRNDLSKLSQLDPQKALRQLYSLYKFHHRKCRISHARVLTSQRQEWFIRPGGLTGSLLLPLGKSAGLRVGLPSLCPKPISK
ncbi:hypothetical protein AXFE_20560 [Acidithrix ferrooxidans]|uniref:Uncharacterized protein n=1 Tax=Acidithrix ferrooxidans TaxID=1280514 RepID=A0A0D8HGE3_9ACTN|nr:hypothetical protein AXFE_20560 [Acidithrix ferrooxidans]